MLPWSADLAGRFDRTVFESELLRGNPLGDPAERPVAVYLPPGYDEEPDRRYPTVYVTMGYTGHVEMWFNRPTFRQPFPELLDAMFAAGEAPPAIVVFADGWNKYGGSQFVDSPGTGQYHSYLCDELVPWIDGRYRTLADRDHRGITGKSSGGYVAMITALLRPDLFSGVVTHAGDALFEVVYPREFPTQARRLRDKYEGSYEKFFAALETRTNQYKMEDIELLSIYACAAAYSAEDDGSVLLPFDEFGALIPEVWERWLAKDPVVMARSPEYVEAIRSLRAVWIDAGRSDEFYLDLGADAFHQAVVAAGLSPDRIHYELFDGTHGAMDHRYTPAIAWLTERLMRD